MRAGVGVIAGLMLVAGSATAGPAAAAPKGMPVELQCGEDSYDAVVNSSGNWSVAHIDSGGIFIPTAFSGFTGTIYDDEGNFVDSFEDDETATKGQSAKKKATVDCTFFFVNISDGSDPEFPEDWTFEGTGAVTGYFVG